MSAHEMQATPEKALRQTMEIRACIIRACPACGGSMVAADGTPSAACVGCGAPAITPVDLGVIDAFYRNPFKQAWWGSVGRRLATRRIQRVNGRRPAPVRS